MIIKGGEIKGWETKNLRLLHTLTPAAQRGGARRRVGLRFSVESLEFPRVGAVPCRATASDT